MMFDELLRIYSLDYASVSALVTASAVLLAVLYYFVKNRNLPPGPYGLPFLGYWPFLRNDDTHLHLDELTKKYGRVFSFTAMGHLLVNLGSFKALRESYITKSECFASRVTSYNLFSFVFGNGIIHQEGEQWKVLRKYFILAFKDHGLSSVKDDMTSPVYDSINTTIEYIRTTKGEPIDLVELLTGKCSVIMRRMMFNDHGITEEEIKDLNKAYEGLFEGMTPKNMLLIGEFSRYFVYPLNPGCRRAVSSHKRMAGMLEQIVERHNSTFDETNVRNMIDSYILERNERKRKGDPAADYFTNKILADTLIQFLGDGVIGIAFFITLFIQNLVLHPEEQDKIYDELMEVVGSERLPTLADKNRLPYTNAFIWESLRGYSFFTTFPSLQCTKDTTIQGYRIPKGAITIFNIWEAHNDPEVYDDPHVFNPSRFLPEPGKTRPEIPALFGVGKRACIGEGFTMMQTFLFLISIVKNFKLTLPEKSVSDATLAVLGNAQICAHPRSTAHK